MRISWIALALLLLTFVLPAMAQEVSDNKDLAALYDADQSDRHFFETTPPSEWKPDAMMAVAKKDAERREQVHAMLKSDTIHTMHDYLYAAMIMQHGNTPEDYLLAHQLAVIAGFKGSDTGKWLAAASLDRFLMAIKRPQVFGTQFNRASMSEPFTMEPYDRSTPDALRREYLQPSLEESDRRLDALQHNQPLPPTMPPPK